jgi:hypothetical protein
VAAAVHVILELVYLAVLAAAVLIQQVVAGTELLEHRVRAIAVETPLLVAVTLVEVAAVQVLLD